MRFYLQEERDLLAIRRVILLTCNDHLFRDLIRRLSRRRVRAVPILIRVCVFIPFRVSCRFVLICLQRALLNCKVRRGSAGEGEGRARCSACHLIKGCPISTHVVGAIRHVFLRQVISTSTKRPQPTTRPHPMSRRVRSQRRRSAHRMKGRRPRHGERYLIMRRHPYGTTRRCRQRGCNGDNRQQARRKHGRLAHSHRTDPPRQVTPFTVLQGILHRGSAAIGRRARHRSWSQREGSVR